MFIDEEEKNFELKKKNPYKKVYLLVHRQEDLRHHYVIRLWDLHIVFTIVRAIGAYIVGSGIH